MAKDIENKGQTQPNKNDIIKALTQDFATSVNRIFINSVGKEYDFREISVKEQKTLARIMIDNEKRKDVVFEAQCALINGAALDPSFDIHELLEFDRLKLMMAIYQANMYKNDIKFTCPNCGEENQYKLDFDVVLHKLDDFDVSDKTFHYENKGFTYDFVLGWPSVNYIAKFHRGNVSKYRTANKNMIQSLDRQSNFDYVNLYIKEFTIISKSNKELKRTVKLWDYSPNDVEEILSVLPQDVIYSEDGVLKYITDEFIKPLNDSFDKHKCLRCGEVYENTVSNAESFF